MKFVLPYARYDSYRGFTAITKFLASKRVKTSISKDDYHSSSNATKDVTAEDFAPRFLADHLLLSLPCRWTTHMEDQCAKPLPMSTSSFLLRL